LPNTYDEFTHHPLASWVESRLGLRTDKESGLLVRALPKSLTGNDGAGHELSLLTGLPEEICVHALQAILLKGYSIANPETNFPAFAFRLHQFISRGDTVYASVEAEADRHITVYGQKFVPGGREKVLLPWLFAVSAAKSITLFGGLEIMKVDLSYFYRASLTKTEIPMVVNQDFST